VDTTDFRKNLKIEVDGDPYIIVDFQHVKPGKGVAFVKTKVKNLLTGNMNEMTFRSGDSVGKPDIDEKEMQFLYAEGDDFHFMDNSNYEQIFITREQLGDTIDWLQENIIVEIMLYEGRAIGVEPPNFVVLEITETDPGVKGDTASGGTKPATLETGAVINVPFHVHIGDKVRIDTRTRQYVKKV
jgi:elongation factor P